MLIHFICNGFSNMSEIDAYCTYIHSRGHRTMVHDYSFTVPANSSVVWWFCGHVPPREAHRLRRAFQIHEYASASYPPYAWLKDQVKHWTQPQPDYRIFQNGWVRERMGFSDDVPYAIRDMGIGERFFEESSHKITPEFDLVYLGGLSYLLAFIPFLRAIDEAGCSLLLVGDLPLELEAHLPQYMTCTGRVPQTQVPHHLRRARFGLNLVPKKAPFQQQTSIRVVEYCAVGLRVISNDYPWVRYFMAQHQASFYLLRDEPSSLATSFDEALDAYPYEVPDVRAMSWPQLLVTMPLWRVILR